MKFSLKAIFALLTLTCLLALVFQEKLKISDLMQRTVIVESKIASYDRWLEKDLPLLKRAVEPDSTIDSLLAHVETNVEKAARSNQPNNLDTGIVSVFYQPSLGDKDPVTIRVHVPENLAATFETQLVDAKHQPVDPQSTEVPFQPPHPFELQLPTGFSTIEIALAAKVKVIPGPKLTNRANSVPVSPPALLSVQLNGKRVHETSFVLPEDFRLFAPRWSNIVHRLDLSEKKRSCQVAAASLFRKFDPLVTGTSRPKYFLKYTVRLGQQPDADSRLIRTESGVEE